MTDATETAVTRYSDPGGGVPRRWAACWFLFLASLMNVADITIVNVALPSMQAGLGASATQLEWVAAVYVLGFAAGLLPFGRYGDIVGRRRMFLAGLTGFILGSLLCGLAPDIGSLIAARAAQGLAGAMMVPQVLAIVHVIFPAEEKGRAFGLFGMVSSLGSVAGPVLGGAIIAADIGGLGWRPIFLINLPLGAIALVGTLRLLPDLPPVRGTRPDALGMVLFAAATVLAVLPLIEGQNFGWPWWCFAMLAAALPAAALFHRWQRLRDRRGRAVLLPAPLRADRGFVAGLAVVTLLLSGVPGLMLVLAVFFQTGFGLTPLESGLTTVPFPVGVALATMLNGRLGAHRLHRRAAAGAAILAIGVAGLLPVLWTTGEALAGWRFAPPLLVAGFGMGVTIMALFQVLMARVGAGDAGAGAGVLQAFQHIGMALGIAIIGQIFFATLPGGAAGRADYVSAAANAVVYPIGVFLVIATVMALWPESRSRRGTA